MRRGNCSFYEPKKAEMVTRMDAVLEAFPNLPTASIMKKVRSWAVTHLGDA